MRTLKQAAFGLTLGLALASGAPLKAAQVFDGGYIYHRGVVRVLQDFHLGPNDAARQALVVYGDATIEGQIDDDLDVVFGNAHIARTALIRGSVIVTAGTVTIDEGATIRGDLVVIGGDVQAPPVFAPGGEHVVIGTTRLGDAMRGVMPWITRGLLWGRVIVPGIGWVWNVLFLFLILTLAINVLLHEPVGAVATTLATRPFSAFATGLLVLLLAGPVAALLAATIVGIAIIPFFLCAIILAWITGKVGVLRWIGRTIFTHGSTEPETRAQAIRSVVVGFVAISLLYMVPIVGIVTWAIVGVFGLGAATLHFLNGLRRERPARPPKVKVEAAPLPASPPPAPPVEPPVEPPPAYAAGDLRAFPHAAFLDRLAALAIDLILVGVVTAIFFSNPNRYDDEPLMPMLFFAYSLLFWAWQGTTLGGIICNLRIVRADGKRMQFVDAFVRALGGVLSAAALGIGFLWILRDPQHQAWHDKIAGTLVVKVPKGTPLD